MERVLVIGNGFNIDLGLNSVGYEQFFSSKEWEGVRSHYAKSGLIRFISERVKKKAFSIENSLNDYASSCPCIYSLLFGKRDKDAYYAIECAFQKYVANGVNCAKGKIHMDSKAFNVWLDFEREKSKGDFDVFNLYSFNYVLLDQIADIINGDNAPWESPRNLIFPNAVICDYIHGRTDGNRNGGSIILGIAKAPKKRFKYMEKSKNQAFMPQKQGYLEKSLKNAKYVELFGVGLWPEDMPYFLDFFQSFKDESFSMGKTIKIYDYNDKSISELKGRIKDAVNNSDIFLSIERSIQFIKTKKEENE
ncbi:MAG: bacteriophage abortive infection AbiH family protein [Bacteroidales bacterium]|nr:bacteriophage abortive infection AbiH family protein [Bacteroidales bacterium]